MAYVTAIQIAERLGIDQGKVLGWIHTGELLAVNIAQGRTSRPRWRVAESDLEAFLSRRTNRPQVSPTRSRRSNPAAKEYY